MRGELRNPGIEPKRLQEAASLASEIYARHEAGAPYEDLLSRLADLTGEPLTVPDASAAFGSVSSETWARELLLRRQVPPSDLSQELLELLHAICAANGEEWQISRWTRCLEGSTGGAEVSDLIFHPAETLEPDDGRVELTPEEILAEAKRRPRRVLVTPPPKGGAA